MNDENKPFNDVIDHFNKVEGNAANIAKLDINKLPKPIRYIGYFIIGFLSLTVLFALMINLFAK